MLGGNHHFPADREAAERFLAAIPEARLIARANRAFLQRAVRYLAAEAGIAQFIDIGAGLPTQGNVHEIAQAIDPDSRVAYVDNDPVVQVHANALLPAGGSTAVIRADMRQPREILDDPGLRRLIDLNRPVAVLFVAVLHFVPEPHAIVRAFLEAIPSGSHLVVSHVTTPESRKESARTAFGVLEDTRATASVAPRSREEILAFFDGCDLVEPGLVELPRWRPDHPGTAGAAEEMWLLGGIGRKR